MGDAAPQGLGGRERGAAARPKTAAAKNALYLNTPNNKKLAVVVGTLLSCKKPKDRILAAGKAPTARMRTFGGALNSACIYNRAGATAFTKAMVAYTSGRGSTSPST